MRDQEPDELLELIERAARIAREADIENAADMARKVLRQAEDIDHLWGRIGWSDPMRLLILAPLLVPILLLCRLGNWIAGRAALRDLERAIR